MTQQPDLRTLVLSRGTILSVAEALGMPRGTLHNWVQGRKLPPEYRLAAVRARIEAMEPRGERGRGETR